MIEIKASVQINAPLEKVWDIVSDLDGEPKFWRQTTRIRNISKEGNVVMREVTIGKDNKCKQTVILYPKEKLHTEFTKGVINGTKDIILSPKDNGTYLEAVLNYKLSAMVSLLAGKIKNNIQNETEEAFQIIKQEAEGSRAQASSTGLKMEERKLWADLFDAEKSKSSTNNT